MPLPAGVAAALITAGGGIVSNVGSALFAKHMASTAHQREVSDLKAAGLNPLLSARGQGAPSPQIEFDNPAASAMQAKLMGAQLELLRNQASEADARRILTLVQARDVEQTFPFRTQEMSSRTGVSDLDASARRAVLHLAENRAKAEIESMMSSAQAARARAVLDEFAREGAFNQAEWESRVGELNPAMRSLMMFIQMLNQSRR